MKKGLTLILAAISAMAVATTAAHAQIQSSSSTGMGATLKVGGFFPQDSNAKDDGNTWLAAGAEYSPQGVSSSSGAGTDFIYADYAGQKKNGLEGHFVGVGVGVRSYAGKSTMAPAGGKPFYTIGFGEYWETVNETGAASSAKSFGGKVGLGYELSHSLVLEADYNLILSKVDGASLDGITAEIGFRF